MSFTLGVDYGTNSVRALFVRCSNGEEIGAAVVTYPSGEEGVLLDAKDAHLARQNPADYLSSLITAVGEAAAVASAKSSDFSLSKVIGIGVDTTGSSPIPVDASNRPLNEQPQFANNLNAHCWLWKDHTSHAEASKITELARQHRPELIAKYGNTYSSEWFWSKIWHCLNIDPEVFNAAHSWVELSDWVPAVLAGVSSTDKIQRGVCAAGHKAMYVKELGGLPDKEFLTLLDSALARLRDNLYQEAHDASVSAGQLDAKWAETLGLPAGIPIAIGEMDVHYGTIGCGITEGTLVKVMGTSTCDCIISSAERKIPNVPGICGLVEGSILPGYYGLEAGQSAVGDIFAWFVRMLGTDAATTHGELTRQAEQLAVGESGLLALDWNNGNRTILVDQRLTGLILGQTLNTTAAEMYRALIEATAFGARMILERLEEYGVHADRIVCAGGIAEKNSMLMQIYADVTGKEIQVAASNQACALGSAISAAVQAGAANGGYDTFTEAMTHMVAQPKATYKPIAANSKTYDQIFSLYQVLHDCFGGVKQTDLSRVMKELLNIQETARRGTGHA